MLKCQVQVTAHHMLTLVPVNLGISTLIVALKDFAAVICIEERYYKHADCMCTALVLVVVSRSIHFPIPPCCWHAM